MCGYCIEGGMVLDYIENEVFSKNEGLQKYWASVCLQESTEFPRIISKLKTLDDFTSSIDIAFYRLWEMFLYGDNQDVYDSLRQEYGEKVISDFLDRINNNHRNDMWAVLGDNDLYIKGDCWKRFIGNRDLLIEHSESTLRSYYDFWLLGIGKETSDPEKIVEEAGAVDPIENTTPKDWDRFYSLFPVAYFSFLVLGRYKHDSEIIKRIALESPHDVPDFLGYDLWLQRKAFAVCVKNHGVQFILDNYDDIRLELIYYSLLRESIDAADLDVLKNHLLSQDLKVIEMDSMNSVVALIDNLKPSV